MKYMLTVYIHSAHHSFGGEKRRCYVVLSTSNYVIKINISWKIFTHYLGVVSFFSLLFFRKFDWISSGLAWGRERERECVCTVLLTFASFRACIYFSSSLVVSPNNTTATIIVTIIIIKINNKNNIVSHLNFYHIIHLIKERETQQ